MTKKIFLVNTNRMRPLIAPIGLDYLAQAIEQEGFEPVLIDLALAENPDELLKNALQNDNPILVGVTIRNIDDCYMASGECFLPDIKNWILKIKAVTDAPVVVGGVGYSIHPKAALEEVGADFGIRGDGEAALPELTHRLLKSEDTSTIPGLVYRSGNTISETHPEYVKPEKFAPRSRNFVDNHTYFLLGGQGSIETKRGCNQQCVYCADPIAKGNKLRLMPPQFVADEIESLLGQGVDVLHLCDSEFNVPPTHAMDVCKELVKRNLGNRVKWYAYLTPAPFTKEMAEVMHAAGCVGINFGTDSAHPQILKNLGRSYTIDDVRSAVSECHKMKIKVMLDLLIGSPGETPETAKHTIETIKATSPDRVGISLGVRVFPGTPLAQQLQDRSSTFYRPRDYPRKDLLYPAFFISPELGSDPEGLVSDLVADDPRFFFADTRKKGRNYNYNENLPLVEAIAKGYRGAYWDILAHGRG